MNVSLLLKELIFDFYLSICVMCFQTFVCVCMYFCSTYVFKHDFPINQLTPKWLA